MLKKIENKSNFFHFKITKLQEIHKTSIWKNNEINRITNCEITLPKKPSKTSSSKTLLNPCCEHICRRKWWNPEPSKIKKKKLFLRYDLEFFIFLPAIFHNHESLIQARNFQWITSTKLKFFRNNVRTEKSVSFDKRIENF